MNDSMESDRELMCMWHEQRMSPPLDPRRVADEVRRTAGRFQRSVRWRNLREVLAGVLGMVLISLPAILSGRAEKLIDTAVFGLGLAIAFGFGWWRQRSGSAADLSANLEQYRRDVLADYDRQIRLARSAGYWYVLPISTALIATTALDAFRRASVAAPHILVFAVVLGLSGFLTWLNAVWGAKRLQAERDRIDSLFRTLNGAL